jgi:hypothetical protein
MHCKLTAIARTALFVGLALGAAPRPAAADFLVTPFLAWSRNPPQPAGTEARWHGGGGVAADWTRGLFIAGGEIGYAPGFFEPSDNLFDLLQTSHVLTATGAAGVSRAFVPARRFYPYATGGFGLLRQQARDRAGVIDVTRNDPSLNFGGGVRVLLKNYLGVRGDLRYFRSLKDAGDASADLLGELPPLAFWRVSMGVVLRFGD